MKFTLNIKLDNEGLKERYQLVRKLKELARELDYSSSPLQGDGGLIHDVNGNHVGSWRVTGK